MQEFGLTVFLKERSIGFEFDANEWPLHITLIDSFEIAIETPMLVNVLNDLLSSTREVDTRAVKMDYFGPNKDILVARLDNTKELQDLHNSLVKLLDANNATFKREYILKENYKPHVTITASESVNVNDNITIKTVSLIDKNAVNHPSLRKVIANINLKD